MEIKKLSLANIAGKLSRTEMKKIMAGSGTGGTGAYWKCCADYNSSTQNYMNCSPPPCVWQPGTGAPSCVATSVAVRC